MQQSKLRRYHGVFAPNFKHRRRIVPNPAHQTAREPHASRPAPMSWMQRLKRVFHIDIEHCGVCGGTLRVIACIETPLKCRSRSEFASPVSLRARRRNADQFRPGARSGGVQILALRARDRPQERLAVSGAWGLRSVSTAGRTDPRRQPTGRSRVIDEVRGLRHARPRPGSGSRARPSRRAVR